MSVNIGDLKYQNPARPLSTFFSGANSIFNKIETVDGFKDKVTISDNHFINNQLEGLQCHDSVDDIPELDTRIAGREIKIEQRSLKVHVCRGTLKETYLHALLKKGANGSDEQSLFLEQLEDVIWDENQARITNDLFLQLYNYAANDNDVARETMGQVTDGASVVANLNKVFDKAVESDYNEIFGSLLIDDTPVAFISSYAYAKLLDYYENEQGGKEIEYIDKSMPNKGVVFRGAVILPLTDFGSVSHRDIVILTTMENLIIFADDRGDNYRTSVIAQNEKNKDLIIMNLGYAMNYKSSRKIVVGVKQ